MEKSNTQSTAREDGRRIVEWFGRQARELRLVIDESGDRYVRVRLADLVRSDQVLVGAVGAAVALALLAIALPWWMTVLLLLGLVAGVHRLRRRSLPLPLADTYLAEGVYYKDADDRDGVPLGTCSGDTLSELADEIYTEAKDLAGLKDGPLPGVYRAIDSAITESDGRFPVVAKLAVSDGHICFTVHRVDC